MKPLPKHLPFLPIIEEAVSKIIIMKVDASLKNSIILRLYRFYTLDIPGYLSIPSV